MNDLVSNCSKVIISNACFGEALQLCAQKGSSGIALWLGNVHVTSAPQITDQDSNGNVVTKSIRLEHPLSIEKRKLVPNLDLDEILSAFSNVTVVGAMVYSFFSKVKDEPSIKLQEILKTLRQQDRLKDVELVFTKFTRSNLKTCVSTFLCSPGKYSKSFELTVDCLSSNNNVPMSFDESKRVTKWIKEPKCNDGEDFVQSVFRQYEEQISELSSQKNQANRDKMQLIDQIKKLKIKVTESKVHQAEATQVKASSSSAAYGKVIFSGSSNGKVKQPEASRVKASSSFSIVKPIGVANGKHSQSLPEIELETLDEEKEDLGEDLAENDSDEKSNGEELTKKTPMAVKRKSSCDPPDDDFKSSPKTPKPIYRTYSKKTTVLSSSKSKSSMNDRSSAASPTVNRLQTLHEMDENKASNKSVQTPKVDHRLMTSTEVKKAERVCRATPKQKTASSLDDQFKFDPYNFEDYHHPAAENKNDKSKKRKLFNPGQQKKLDISLEENATSSLKVKSNTESPKPQSTKQSSTADLFADEDSCQLVDPPSSPVI